MILITPALWSMTDPQEQLKEALETLDVNQARSALDQGADANYVYSPYNLSPVYMLIALAARPEIAKNSHKFANLLQLISLVLDRGAQLTTLDRLGRTPLHALMTTSLHSTPFLSALTTQLKHFFTISRTQPTPDPLALLARLLIDRGAQVNAINSNNQIPLEYALTVSPALVKLLINKGSHYTRANSPNTIIFNLEQYFALNPQACTTSCHCSSCSSYA